MKLALPVLCLIALAIATSPKVQKVSFLDNVDNPPSAVPVPQLIFVDASAGGALYYNAWNYIDQALSQTTLKTPSPPYAIGSGPVAQLEQGQPAFYPINSSITTFDEKSIYYACIENSGNGQLSIPTTCTIQATGVNAVTGPTVPQELPYNPSLLPVANTYNFTTFAPAFTNLNRLQLTLLSSVVPATTVIILVDSHSYDAYIEE